MAYDFSTRLDHLGDRLKVLNPDQATFARSGIADLTDVTVSPIKIDHAELQSYGISIETDMRMYAVDRADIGVFHPFKEGDKMTVGSTVFEIQSDTMEGPTWKFSTNTEKRILFFTKKITVE